MAAVFFKGFGRAVLAIDLTGDGFSEVIVGAPDFFEYRTHGGAVYIYSHNNTVMDGFREEPFMTLKVTKQFSMHLNEIIFIAKTWK